MVLSLAQLAQLNGAKWSTDPISVAIGSRLIESTLEKALAEKKGCLIGRQGSVELGALLSGSVADPALTRNAGIFPTSDLAQWLES